MSALSVFDFDSHNVRIVSNDPFNPLFVANDVASALGYKDLTNAIKNHCNGVAKHHPIKDSMNRTQKVRVIGEPDLYRLIFGSKLKTAQRFQNWVFEEVLPKIRQAGKYQVEPKQKALPKVIYLTASMKHHIKKRVMENVRRNNLVDTYAAAWTRIHDRFHVNTYDNILAADYPMVCDYLQMPMTKQCEDELAVIMISQGVARPWSVANLINQIDSLPKVVREKVIFAVNLAEKKYLKPLPKPKPTIEPLFIKPSLLKTKKQDNVTNLIDDLDTMGAHLAKIKQKELAKVCFKASSTLRNYKLLTSDNLKTLTAMTFRSIKVEDTLCY